MNNVTGISYNELIIMQCFIQTGLGGEFYPPKVGNSPPKNLEIPPKNFVLKQVAELKTNNKTIENHANNIPANMPNNKQCSNRNRTYSNRLFL